MSFCEICHEQLPGHQIGCPVLTQQQQPGVGWVTQGKPETPKVLGEVVYGALEHAYEALEALQSCCKGEDSDFYQNVLWRLRALINGVKERLE